MLGVPQNGLAQLPAFPGAQGFGAGATGGRGGEVLHVTHLGASGEGSLAWAAAQSGPRYVVFDVSGVIEGDVEITNSDITIAGQTAPGAGITVHGHLYTPYDAGVGNIVIRHLRVRPPPADSEWAPAQHDAVQLSDAHRLMLDHVDFSHGIDEIVDLWNAAQDVSVQWSALTFPDPDGGHPDGEHPYCIINSAAGGGEGAGGRISLHHNLFAHCRTRTPALGAGPAEVINNVVYGGREGFVHHNAAYGDFVIGGNVYRDGPDRDLVPFWLDPENADPPTRYYMGDNWVDHPGTFEGIVDDPFETAGFDYTFVYDGRVGPEQVFPLSDRPDWSGMEGWVPVDRDAPMDAYDAVLECAGTWPRDFVTERAVTETADRTGAITHLALDDLLEGLTPGDPPTDTDGDGMPDAWERDHGLDPDTPDHDTALEGGWPALEVYLNEVADGLSPCESGPGPMPDGGVPTEDAGPGGGDGGVGGDDGGPSGGDDGGAVGDDGGGSGGDPGGDDGGCGCRTAGHGKAPGTVLLMLALAALLRPRRRH